MMTVQIGMSSSLHSSQERYKLLSFPTLPRIMRVMKKKQVLLRRHRHLLRQQQLVSN
jgi:hypothetical protein